MSQQFRKTILIVCEGARTEPDYFQELRNLVLNKDKNIFIKIDPIPKAERLRIEEEEVQNARQGRRVRQIKNTHIQFPELEVESEYLTQPTYYVRKAQLGLYDQVYDEVWAVYDKDGHAAHAAALELSAEVIEKKKVNIAFNSIAFEYWILLHFESNTNSFEKSMCREGKNHFYCGGADKHNNDCKGVNCVCGRIVTEGYLNYEGKKKVFSFSKYNKNVDDAIERAVMLKNSYKGSSLAIYEMNPYCTTHRIAFKLLHLPEIDYTWFEFDDIQTNNNLAFNFEYVGSLLRITINKNTQQSKIINNDDFCLIDKAGNSLSCGQRKLMQDNVFTIDVDLNAIQNFNPIFIGIKKHETQYLITELPI